MSDFPEITPGQAEPPAPPNQDVFWGYHDLFLFVLIAVPSLLVSALAVKGIFVLLHLRLEAKALELLPAQFLGYALMFLGLYFVLRVQYRRPFWRSMGFVRPPAFPAAYLVFGVGLAFLIAMLGAILRTPDVQTPLKDLLSTRTAVLAIGLVAVTIGPVSEELIFRGLLQPLLERSTGRIAGIWLAAIPFGLLHLGEYGWSWRHGLLITCAGAAFGWMRRQSGSTWAASIMHAGYNAALFAGYIWQGKDLPQTW